MGLVYGRQREEDDTTYDIDIHRDRQTDKERDIKRQKLREREGKICMSAMSY